MIIIVIIEHYSDAIRNVSLATAHNGKTYPLVKRLNCKYLNMNLLTVTLVNKKDGVFFHNTYLSSNLHQENIVIGGGVCPSVSLIEK